MWCKDCRQDVPALISGDNQSFCCPRCGGILCAESKSNCQSDPPADPTSYDGWEMGEELDELGRTLRGARLDDRLSKAIHRREAKRFDRPHADLPDWHSTAAASSQLERKPDAVKSGAVLGALIWCSLALGTMGFICGGVLMGWSLIAGREELWAIGVPAALIGQIALLVGLVLQLDRIRRDHRRSADKLEDVDERLSDLKTAATLLSANNGAASTAFYAHFAGGASPQLLLTDLKSQLDLLATKIAREEQ
ncbi:MAG: hypothetical protein JW959_03375 [Pirellulales bacterium]|nr:hypothetical protein [Pirellulales bacterium]